MMELVLGNLINNAVKFTPQHGRIAVSLRKGNEAWFRIRDNGVGIPPDQLERIFRRFYQVESPLRRRHEGLGLGLSIAQELLRLQNGRIWARSSGSDGSEFIVALPRLNNSSLPLPLSAPLFYPPNVRVFPILDERQLSTDPFSVYRIGMNKKSISLALFVLLAALFSVSGLRAQSEEIVVLSIDGAVNQTLFTYLERGVREAVLDDAHAVLVTMDTPGGEGNAMLEIVRLFQNSPVPVLVYVGPDGAQAASAGSVITAAAHAAGMAPNTVIGAASPINGDGSDINETLYRKLVEDLKATMRSLTERRGPEAVALAEGMIEDARAVSASEALAVGFIDAVAETPEEFLDAVDGLVVEVDGEEMTLETAERPLLPITMRFIEQFLYFIATPTVISILMAIAVPAILSEISNPGGWVAGFIGVVALALGLYGLGQLPVNWLGLVLVGVAFVLFILEVTSEQRRPGNHRRDHPACRSAGSLQLARNAGVCPPFAPSGDFRDPVSFPFSFSSLSQWLSAHSGRSRTAARKGWSGKSAPYRAVSLAMPRQFRRQCPDHG
jgi:ATP-dependent protease ClpP protease subunit